MLRVFGFCPAGSTRGTLRGGAEVAGPKAAYEAQDLPMGGAPLLARGQLGRFRLQERHVEGPEIEGVQHPVPVTFRPNVRRELGVGDTLGRHRMDANRGFLTVPRRLEASERLRHDAVMVEKGEVDLDLGLLHGTLRRPSVEQVEVQGEGGPVVGDVAADVAVGVRVEEGVGRNGRVGA